MAYLTKDLMIKYFGEAEIIQLTDRLNSGVIDEDVLGQAMTTAEAEADSYIGTVYSLPLPSTPPTLPAFVADIARYKLFANQPSETVQQRYDRAINWLRDVAKGIVSLGYRKTDTQPEGTVIAAKARTQIFTDSLLSKMGPTPWTSL